MLFDLICRIDIKQSDWKSRLCHYVVTNNLPIKTSFKLPDNSIDAPPYQSGQYELKSRSISKRGSSSLRRTLFLIMSVILQNSPEDQPIYQFMDKKRSEGKPYKVYMMASANKFLRIYYASVTKYLDSLKNA